MDSRRIVSAQVAHPGAADARAHHDGGARLSRRLARRLTSVALGLLVAAGVGLAAPAAASDDEARLGSANARHGHQSEQYIPYPGGELAPGGAVVAAVTCGVSTGPGWSQWRYFNCSSGLRAVHYRSALTGVQCMTVSPYTYSAVRLRVVDTFLYAQAGRC